MRNRFHSLCPYFAMFPESFVRRHLVWSKPGDTVLDPFSGRGTTAFESLLGGRAALAGDTNPVAVCVSRAKADPPTIASVRERLEQLRLEFNDSERGPSGLQVDPFFQLCFAQETLEQVLFLRDQLQWKTRRTDTFIAALALGCLHGESHRSKWVFSNRMPRTISTKPDYSVRWWKKQRCVPPRRDVFSILRQVAEYRYVSPLPELRGRIASCDARHLASRFKDSRASVSLVITSPPYLDTTNYREDQWLRLWFLGGASRPTRQKEADDRHRGAASYWMFLEEAWRGVAPLLKDGAHLVVRIGGRHIEKASVEAELRLTLVRGLGASLRLRDRLTSRITNGQLQAFRPGAKGTEVEHDFHYQIQ